MDFNTNLLLINIKHVAGTILGTPFGSTHFYILLGATIFIMAFVGNLINSIVNGNSRGMIATCIGVLLPVAVGIGAYSLTSIYINQFFTDPNISTYACLAVAGALGLFTLIFVTPLFLASGFIKSAITFVLVMICVAVGLHFSAKGIMAFENSGQAVSESSKAGDVSHVEL